MISKRENLFQDNRAGKAQTSLLRYMKRHARILKSWLHLSHDIASGSYTTPCNKFDKPRVAYRLNINIFEASF